MDVKLHNVVIDIFQLNLNRTVTVNITLPITEDISQS